MTSPERLWGHWGHLRDVSLGGGGMTTPPQSGTGGYLHMGSVMAWSWVPRYSPRWDRAVTTLSLATKRWTPWERGWGRLLGTAGDTGMGLGTGRDVGDSRGHRDGVGDRKGRGDVDVGDVGDTGMGLGTGRDVGDTGMGLGTKRDVGMGMWGTQGWGWGQEGTWGTQGWGWGQEGT